MNYEEIITNEDVLYNSIMSAIEGSKWKPRSQKAIKNVVSLVFSIADMLRNRTYVSDQNSHFITYERGRKRYIETYNIPDRTIRHAICDYIFAPIIKNKIIYDNSASVQDRGVDFARERFETHLHKYYRSHGTNEGYILFGDFSKYYDNIRHDQAKQQLLDLVDGDEFVSWLLDVIFKGFEVDASNLSDDEYKVIDEGVLNKLEYPYIKTRHPKRTLKKSISIGDQLSQQIGIYYPHEIDNYVKIVKSQKYYGRYMDDWYIISDSKEELRNLLHEIVEKSKELGLTINLTKTRIVKLSSTYKWLQVKYSLTSTGHVIKRINPVRVTKMRNKLRKLAIKVQNGETSYIDVEIFFKSWMGSFYKLMSKDQRLGLLSLYEDLFNKEITIVKGSMIIVDREEA